MITSVSALPRHLEQTPGAPMQSTGVYHVHCEVVHHVQLQ